MPTRNLADACSILRDAVPILLNQYNGRYGPHVHAKVGEVLRTTQEQIAKYAQGRSSPGKIVTYADGVTNLSSHQAQAFHDETCSHALDINLFRETGEYVAEQKPYLPLIGLAVADGLSSGGEWKRPDYPHLHCPLSKA